MKLLILTNNLKEGVAIVSRLTQKSINLPILNNLLLQTEKNFLKVSATDLELGVKFWALAKIEKEGQITVPGKVFAGLVNSLFEEKVKIEERGQALLIEGENTKSKILGQTAEDYPLIPEIKDGALEIDSASFIQALFQVADVTASTQIRPELSGVYLSFSKEGVVLVASDSFRLAEKKLTLKETSLAKEISLILPQKAARELITILGEKEGKLKIYLTSNQVMFETEIPETSHPQLQITSRLIEGSYPNYQEIIPKEFKTQIVLNRGDFLDKLKTASFFTGKVNEVHLSVDPQKGQIEIFSQSPDLGENRSLIAGKIEGEKGGASFNHHFLADGLLKIKTGQVVFQLNGQEGPAVLKPMGDETYLYIVMPIKPS